jgi:hypothetical protein
MFLIVMAISFKARLQRETIECKTRSWEQGARKKEQGAGVNNKYENFSHWR